MRSLKKYLIALGIGLGLVLWIASARGVFHQTSPLGVYRILCDAFFVAGAVLAAAGLMVFTTNEGAFDLFVYGIKSTANVFRKNDIKKYDSYYDYRNARAEKKYPFLFILVCAVFFLAVAAVMYFLYSAQ